MVTAQGASQVGNKIIDSGESLLTENTLGKGSFLFQPFPLCCFAIRVNFSRHRGELLSPVRQKNTGKVFSPQGKRAKVTQPKDTLENLE